jgi:5-methylcytosine-specific restriction endonuclease McrA
MSNERHWTRRELLTLQDWVDEEKDEYWISDVLDRTPEEIARKKLIIKPRPICMEPECNRKIYTKSGNPRCYRCKARHNNKLAKMPKQWLRCTKCGVEFISKRGKQMCVICAYEEKDQKRQAANLRWYNYVRETKIKNAKTKRDFGGNYQKVLARDNYQCQMCKRSASSSVQLEVHHIDGNKANSAITNLIVLCSRHHHKVQGDLIRETTKRVKRGTETERRETERLVAYRKKDPVLPMVDAVAKLLGKTTK